MGSGKENISGRFDVAIAGGGLAGLSLSIQLARQGYKVLVLEKEKYPFHKVCGEYISMESWNFLEDLGLNLRKLNVSIIDQLQVSAVNGKLLQHKLPSGGFGISRSLLDFELMKLAVKAGVTVYENCKVEDILFDKNDFTIVTSQDEFKAMVVCACYGKRSNIDVKWKRPFITTRNNKLNNYIGIKYHVIIDFPGNTIALHNFKNGYCGISRIEGDKYCLCYLTTADNLKRNGGSIKKMEQQVLCQNPRLKKIFDACEILYNPPVIISQISFEKKTQTENHVLMIGDAAGMITPLCGNGMSMALHAGKLVSTQIGLFLKGAISRSEMEKNYTMQWQNQFAGRLKAGRMIQRLFGKKWLTNFFIAIIKPFPGLIDRLIKQTHGEPF